MKKKVVHHIVVIVLVSPFFYIYILLFHPKRYIYNNNVVRQHTGKKYHVVAFVDQSRKIYEETELNLFLNVFRYETSVKYKKNTQLQMITTN